MRKILSLAICVALILTMTAAVALAETATGTGTAKGFGGDITVVVTLDGDAVTDLEITAPDETPTVGGAAIEPLKEAILAAQRSSP